MHEGGLLSLKGNFIYDRAKFIQSPGHHLLDTDVSSCDLGLGPLMTSLLLEALFLVLPQQEALQSQAELIL